MNAVTKSAPRLNLDPFQILIFTSVFDGFWTSYSGVWFMTQWIPKLDPTTISGREMIGSMIAICCGLLLTKYKQGEVSLKEIFWITLLSDSTILLVFKNINLVAICSTMIGQIYYVYAHAFWSKLINTNIQQDRRVKFDTTARTVEKIGRCIGAGTAIMFPLTIKLEYAYICMVLVMDLDFMIRLGLIKFKILDY